MTTKSMCGRSGSVNSNGGFTRRLPTATTLRLSVSQTRDHDTRADMLGAKLLRLIKSKAANGDTSFENTNLTIKKDAVSIGTDG